MPISSSNMNLRAGVCTSTTRPTTPYNGQVIYETDTKQTLVWQGSAWVMLTDADQPPGLQLVASGTASPTNASPLYVSSVFTSEFRNYRLLLTCTQFYTSGDIYMRFLTGTTTQYTNAYYNYGWGGSYVSSAPTYYYAAWAQTNPFAPASFWYLNSLSTGGYEGTTSLDITAPNVLTETRFVGQSWSPLTGSWYNLAISGTGGVEAAVQFTGFMLYPTAGTTEITYRLYGYRD